MYGCYFVLIKFYLQMCMIGWDLYMGGFLVVFVFGFCVVILEFSVLGSQEDNLVIQNDIVNQEMEVFLQRGCFCLFVLL